ncbi:transposase, MuDR, plant [Tanacetum coccineum]
MKKIHIYVHHEGIFTADPFKYSEGDVDECPNIDLGKTNQSRLVQIIKECCKFSVESIYYCAPKKDLSKHLKPLRIDEELAMFIKTAFDNGGKIDLFVEHHGYDVIADYMRPENVDEELDEEIEEIELEDISEYVGPENVGEDDVVIAHVGVQNSLLNKLVDDKYIKNEDVNANLGRKCTSLTPDEIEDNAVDDRFKVKAGEHLEHLKECMINYGVANGYRLWYRRNDYKNIAVLCGRNVKEGRCSSQKGKQKVDDDEGVSRRLMRGVNPKSKGNPKPTPNSDYSQKGCAFRLWASWMQDVRDMFFINVSIGQCKRAKQMVVYNYEGGLIDHYGKLWDYRHQLLTSNHGSTVELEVETLDGGKTVFKRMYICFKAMKDGWSGGCRRVIGLDGCFLASTCRVRDLLPHDEHRMCARHIYANFKKKWNGLHYKTLFWGAAYSTLEVRSCVAFENGISESYHNAILFARDKPIITMLEDIRIYLMQRMVAMNEKATTLADPICPSITKELDKMKYKQRYWQVVVSGFQEFEVRKADDGFGVNLQNKTCTCKWWDLSGIPCVHAVAAYSFLNRDPVVGVSNWFTKQMWVNSYSHFIKPVSGTSLWVKSDKVPPLPPKKRKMPGHNKVRCFNQTRPKPVVEKRKPGRKRKNAPNQPYMPPDPAFQDPYFTEPHFADPQFADSYYADTTGSASVDPGSASVDPRSASADPRSAATNDPRSAATNDLRSVASDVHTFTGLKKARDNL